MQVNYSHLEGTLTRAMSLRAETENRQLLFFGGVGGGVGCSHLNLQRERLTLQKSGREAKRHQSSRSSESVTTVVWPSEEADDWLSSDCSPPHTNL